MWIIETGSKLPEEKVREYINKVLNAVSPTSENRDNLIWHSYTFSNAFMITLRKNPDYLHTRIEITSHGEALIKIESGDVHIWVETKDDNEVNYVYQYFLRLCWREYYLNNYYSRNEERY